MTEQDIRDAIDGGCVLYWAENKLQSEAWSEWKARNFEGECPQIAQGSINDYVFRSVMKMMSRTNIEHFALTARKATMVDQEEEIRADERDKCATRLEIAADAWIKEGAEEIWPKRLMNLAIQIRQKRMEKSR